MASESAKAILTIDLGALTANYARLCREAPVSEVAGVVKANGYGLGVLEVARALREVGCRSFFVAHLDEGLALRPHLADAAIYVLHGLAPRGEADTEAAGLIPILNQPDEIARWAAFARHRERRLPAAVQIDTGMCRLGFSRAGIEGLNRSLLEPLDLRLVMSHLACAEEADNPLNQRQQARFDELRERLPRAPASLANSSGIFLGSSFHYQLCRPGVALYGVNPTPGRVNPMAPVVKLEAPVLQVHDVIEAGTVGYGATRAIGPGSRIATVPVGYADGYPRAVSDRAAARIGSWKASLAGRVSMDLISLDVGGLPREAVQPGTMVELIFGPNGLDELAEAAGTIGYEILTRLGTRFARRYTRPAVERPV
ncbi:MAG: alanine racemase [Geminicoccaceae bacterium]